MAKNDGSAVRTFFEDEVQDVLRETFYATEKPVTAKRVQKPKPDHYEVICISMYKEDLARLDDKVNELKASGHRRMTRSALIRFALDQADLSKLPRGL